MLKVLRGFMIVGAMLLAAPAWAANPRVEAIQSSVGLSEWKDVQRVAFTWTLPSFGLARTYDWDVKKGTVVVTTADGRRTIPASGAGLTDPKDIDAHKAFINDSYWLLFEFHTAWDRVTITDVNTPPTPVGADEVGVAVQYTSGGYTPGDRYVLWSKLDGQVTHWQYFPGGAADAKFLMTREGWKTFGKIRVPTTFKKDGDTFIQINDVTIQ